MEALNIELTQEELSKYNSSKKDDENLPKVYSTKTQTSNPISRDMEAFLILEDFNFKDTLADSVKAILDTESNDDEKELFEEAWNNERDVVRNEIADINSKLGTTAEVREGLRKSKFVNVPDINDLLTIISTEQSTLGTKQRMTQYRLVYLEQFKIKFSPGEVAEPENTKAAKSWLNPLTAY